MNHFDMPLFKGQIGTSYEEKGRICRKAGQKDEANKQFRKAIKHYQEALELAKELKIPGMLNTALYNRNIANAHRWLEENREAYQPLVEALIFFRLLLSNCLNWKIHCDDHISLSHVFYLILRTHCTPRSSHVDSLKIAQRWRSCLNGFDFRVTK